MAWSVAEKKGEAKKGAAGKVESLHPGRGDEGGAGGKDLAGGMEMLELDFLLSVVEQTSGEDKNDVTMRKLVFNELLRRQNQNEIDSKALKVYAVNEGNLYGKVIQCEAMKELTKRTAQKTKGG